MTDQPSATPPAAAHLITIDSRDVVGALGVVLMVGGAAFVHWGLAATLLGAGLFGWAFVKSRRG